MTPGTPAQQSADYDRWTGDTHTPEHCPVCTLPDSACRCDGPEGDNSDVETRMIERLQPDYLPEPQAEQYLEALSATDPDRADALAHVLHGGPMPVEEEEEQEEESERVGHTPGPWEVETPAGRGAWIKGSTGYCALSAGNTDEEAAANAQLIAGAPDLLAALEDLLEAADGIYEDWETVAAREAVAKARGQVAA